MNNQFKLILVATVSFILGVVATKVLSPDNYSAAITPRQKELQKIAIEAERRPFFPNAKTETKVTPASSPEPEIPQAQATPSKFIASPKDYLALSEELSQFNTRLFSELKKKFKSIPLNAKDNREAMNNEHLRNSLEFMFQEKELWYKSTVDDDLSQSKMYLFFKYYNCQAKEPRPGIKLSETCYMFQMFNFRGGVWYQSNISSQVNGLLWNSDTPYVQIELTGLGNLSKDTGAFFAVVPTPNEQMPMQYLKYEEGKVSWIEGKEVRWSKSSQKEIDKFEAWTHR